MAANQTAPATLGLSITGMTCGSCVRHVTEALRGVNGVTDAQVDLGGGRATVSFDPASATVEQMVRAVEEAGYGAAADAAEQDRSPGLLVLGSACGSSCCA